MTTLYLVGHQPGYSPQISSLVGMLAYARFTTLHAVKDFSLDLGAKAAQHLRDQSLEHYLHELERVRNKTLEEFSKRDDAWLLEPLPCPWEEGAQWTQLFQWFHVMEDELNHRGQIRLIRKLLPS